MHLLDARTLQIQYFYEHDAPPYAILSHTWSDEEVTFQDMTNGKDFHIHKRGYSKIREFCQVAQAQGFQYVWVDTCCIDKASSAELSEAINSMYRWYQEAAMCVAYLEDVPSPMDTGEAADEDSLARSRWFTRGWTLQELIAPKHLEFFSGDWVSLGTKFGLRNFLSRRTSIDVGVLSGGAIDSISVAEKMSWAAHRVTTRREDAAYCLLGLFKVNMPLLYGEGMGAFRRLQHEILRQREDYSILLWSQPMAMGNPISPVIATSPSAFSADVRSKLYPGNSEATISLSSLSKVSRFSGQQFVRDHPAIFPDAISPLAFDPPSITNRGLSTTLNLFELKNQPYQDSGSMYAWTYYRLDDRFVCIQLSPQRIDTGTVHLRIGDIHLISASEVSMAKLETIFLSLEPVESGVDLGLGKRHHGYQEPALTVQGIQPSPAFMVFWDTLTVKNQGSKSERLDFRYILDSSLSMEEYNHSNAIQAVSEKPESNVETTHGLSSSSPDHLDFRVTEIFRIIPKPASSPSADDESIGIVLGLLGGMVWCRRIAVPEFPTALKDMKDGIEATLRGKSELSDQSSIMLQGGDRVFVGVRLGKPVTGGREGQAKLSYAVTISINKKENN
ncbi:hypothetical protein CEP54_012912 [Fusarium duplospermum]|uniref:Uncharacterized protein n=1 Tax=Fusarium duplospermum TaxID=1325734 RepID=A0A428P623_9HYPO|nr:hypothetical protein CEP54_012912 [Fusarium duplospermum]